MHGILGKKTSLRLALIRLTLPCVAISAFLNNTPIVAMLIPIVISWAARAGVDSRKLLIPMAYAVTFGGTITLIGTSTNLVVTGKEK
jgi:Na+/H+ antiporter NhaD/arsenite permease-like protein